jgi:predicted 3-demethylubiquinone-9 3-methyltransferase (glyoxalase superfamily)
MSTPIETRLDSRQADLCPQPKEAFMPQRITPTLWFDTEAEDAARFYTSVFPSSRIIRVTRYPDGGPRPAGMVTTVEFELDGQRLVALNGGPEFTFDEAVSLEISCETQEEVDYYWSRLSDGGEEWQCGWLKDRYGLSWQVVPTTMWELFTDHDPERAARAMHAILGMRRIDIAVLHDDGGGQRAEKTASKTTVSECRTRSVGRAATGHVTAPRAQP